MPWIPEIQKELPKKVWKSWGGGMMQASLRRVNRQRLWSKVRKIRTCYLSGSAWSRHAARKRRNGMTLSLTIRRGLELSQPTGQHRFVESLSRT